MDKAITGGIIGAGGGVLSGIVNGLFSQSESEKAYDREMEMIKYQNAYNTPAEQMKRYTEAGLNPNLIYGGGTASAGNMSNIPQYKPAQMNMNNFAAEGYGQYLNTLQTQSNLETNVTQRKFIEANTFKALQDAFTSMARENNLDVNSAKTAVDRKNAEEFGKYIGEAQQASIDSLYANMDFLDKRSEEIDNSIEFKNEQKKNFKWQRENLKSDLQTKKYDRWLKGLTGKEKKNHIINQEYGVEDGGILGTFGKMMLRNVGLPADYYYQKYFK